MIIATEFVCTAIRKSVRGAWKPFPGPCSASAARKRPIAVTRASLKVSSRRFSTQHSPLSKLCNFLDLLSEPREQEFCFRSRWHENPNFRKGVFHMVTKFHRVLFWLLAVCLCAISLFAQITGDLQVRVVDMTDAAAPNATIIARNVETGTTRTVNTDATGSARINQLSIGTYEIKVSL